MRLRVCFSTTPFAFADMTCGGLQEQSTTLQALLHEMHEGDVSMSGKRYATQQKGDVGQL